MKNFAFAVLPEFGKHMHSTAPEVKTLLAANELDLYISSNENEENSVHNVAIMITKRLLVHEVLRDEFGSLIGLGVLCPNKAKVLLVGMYQPPGLDTLPLTSSDEKKTQTRDQATQTYETLLTWMDDYDQWIVAGDANETIDATQDRVHWTEGTKTAGQPNPNSLIRYYSTKNGWVDVFTHCNPNVHDETRFTFGKRNSALSRIDYMLCSRLIVPLKCKVEDYRRTLKTDHDALFATFELQQPLRRPKVHARTTKSSRVHDATEEEKIECATFVVKITARNEQDWIGRMHRLEATALNTKSVTIRDQCETMLNQLVKDIRFTICNAAERTLGIKTKDGRHPFKSKQIALQCLEIRQIQQLRLAFVRQPLTQWAESKQKGYFLNEKVRWLINSLSRHNIQYATLKMEPLKWAQWLAYDSAKRIRDIADSIQKQMAIMKANDSIKNIYYDQNARKAFYDNFFRYKTNQQLDYAIHPATQKPLLKPEEYKPVIRAAIAEKFSKEYDAPPSPKPLWWDEMYQRGSVEATWELDTEGKKRSIFHNIMAPTTVTEVFELIHNTEKGKSSEDELSIDLLKIITANTNRSTAANDPVIRVLSELINLEFRLAIVPPSMKKGKMTLLKKAGKKKAPEGTIEYVREMRPITVLPELGKMPFHILANRLSTTLVEHPNAINSAQRGFLKNGNTSQCVSLTLDIIEDYQKKAKDAEEKKAAIPKLFVVTYDQAKAYDCIQKYTIRASLERMNLPESFIQFILSSLTRATSYIHTAGGDTEPFPILTSVRQGDPISPLLYVIIADPLHSEIQKLHTGYHFKCEQKGDSDVGSTGYADDLTTFAETETHIKLTHTMICRFFSAHRFEINTGKSHFSFLPFDAKSELKLSSVAEYDRLMHSLPPSETKEAYIRPKPTTEPYHLLGLDFTLDLNWDAQIKVLQKAIKDFENSIRRHKMDVLMAANAYREYLLPKLEMGLKYASIPLPTLENWSNHIVAVILKTNRARLGRTLKRSAFRVMANMPSLEDHQLTVRTAEIVMQLNSQNSPSNRSAWMRLNEASEANPWPGKLNYAPGKDPISLINLSFRQGHTKKDGGSRFIKWIKELRKQDLKFTFSNAKWWNIETKINTRIAEGTLKQYLSSRAKNGISLYDKMDTMYRLPQADDQSITVYTDGSTKPHSSPNSGFAAIFVNQDGTKVSFSGAIRTDWNNFLAEMAGIALAIYAAPINVRLTIKTDSQAAIASISKKRTTERERIRGPGRALANTIRKMLQQRTAPTLLQHVTSHTEQTNEDADGNDAADHAANQARETNSMVEDLPHFMTNEETVCMWIRDKHVPGDVRKTVKEHLFHKMVQTWATQKDPKHRNIQGEFSSKYREEILTLAKQVRNANHPKAFLFLIMAICQWLPTKDRMSKWDQPSRDNPYCEACTLHVNDTLSHCFNCDSGKKWQKKRSDSVKEELAKVDLDELFFSSPQFATLQWYQPKPETMVTEKRAEQIVIKSITQQLASAQHEGRHPTLTPLELKDIVSSIVSHNRIAGALGILPNGLHALIEQQLWRKMDNNAPLKVLRKRVQRGKTNLLASIRHELFWNAFATYADRCNAKPVQQPAPSKAKATAVQPTLKKSARITNRKRKHDENSKIHNPTKPTKRRRQSDQPNMAHKRRLKKQRAHIELRSRYWRLQFTRRLRL